MPEKTNDTVKIAAALIALLCSGTAHLTPQNTPRLLSGLAKAMTDEGVTGELPDALVLASRLIQYVSGLVLSGEVTGDTSPEDMRRIMGAFLGVNLGKDPAFVRASETLN